MCSMGSSEWLRVAPRLRWIHRSGAQRRILAVQGVSRHFLAASAKNKPLFLPMNLFWWPRNFITLISSIIFWLLLLAASSESVLNALYWGYADNPQGRIWPHISTMEEGGSASSRVTSGRILDQWINQRKKMRSCFQNHPKPYHNSLIHCICGKLSAIFIHAHSIIWDFNPSFMVGLWQPVALVGARPRHPKW